MNLYDLIIIGGGACGCFAAIVSAEMNPFLKIRILEKTRQPLSKVKISGGGRCNVTHGCFDISRLSEAYPRGRDWMRSALHRFQPEEMMKWLLKQGVELKIEADGRCFPNSDRSQTIIDCFLNLIQKYAIELTLESDVCSIQKNDSIFRVETKKGEILYSRNVLVATGGVVRSYDLLAQMGVKIVEPIASLFTFHVEEPWIKQLSGQVAKNSEITFTGAPWKVGGPLLLTHFGISGPAVLKLSAFAARWLFDRKYNAEIKVNWIGTALQETKELLFDCRKKNSSKNVSDTPLFGLSKRFWQELVSDYIGKKWNQISKLDVENCAERLTRSLIKLTGKTANKEEFVTCGGVDLDEIDPKTMQIKKIPGLYVGGEVTNIDGITGGFNFQNAWTAAYVAAETIAKAATVV